MCESLNFSWAPGRETRQARGRFAKSTPFHIAFSCVALAFCLRFLLFPVSRFGPKRRSCDGPGRVIRALPPRYSRSVLWLSADNGKPTPPAWYIIARDQTRQGLPTDITVSRGRIISNAPSLNARARIKGLSPISIGRIGINSTNAWNMARLTYFERGQRLGSVNYSLQQQGRDASPVWSVWCFDRSGRYIGFLSILASTGAVISIR